VSAWLSAADAVPQKPPTRGADPAHAIMRAGAKIPRSVYVGADVRVCTSATNRSAVSSFQRPVRHQLHTVWWRTGGGFFGPDQGLSSPTETQRNPPIGIRRTAGGDHYALWQRRRHVTKRVARLCNGDQRRRNTLCARGKCVLDTTWRDDTFGLRDWWTHTAGIRVLSEYEPMSLGL